MTARRFLFSFTTIFAITFVVIAIVSFLYSLILHGAGTIDWGRAVGLAIVLGIILSWMAIRERKRKGG
jgi:hypothetical protein